MIRRPPRSTPFPTRRSSDLISTLLRQLHLIETNAAFSVLAAVGLIDIWLLYRFFRQQPLGAIATGPRSEEHTSELQSQSNLVCRLLLEKKNNARPFTRTPSY